jgi:hypothetical protein
MKTKLLLGLIPCLLLAAGGGYALLVAFKEALTVPESQPNHEVMFNSFQTAFDRQQVQIGQVNQALKNNADQLADLINEHKRGSASLYELITKTLIVSPPKRPEEPPREPKQPPNSKEDPDALIQVVKIAIEGQSKVLIAMEAQQRSQASHIDRVLEDLTNLAKQLGLKMTEIKSTRRSIYVGVANKPIWLAELKVAIRFKVPLPSGPGVVSKIKNTLDWNKRPPGVEKVEIWPNDNPKVVEPFEPRVLKARMNVGDVVEETKLGAFTLKLIGELPVNVAGEANRVMVFEVEYQDSQLSSSLQPATPTENTTPEVRRAIVP